MHNVKNGEIHPNKRIFDITSPQIGMQKEKTFKARISRQGCDFLRLKVRPPHEKLLTIPIVSKIGIIQCPNKKGEDALYYVNKAENKLFELTNDPCLIAKVAKSIYEGRAYHPNSEPEGLPYNQPTPIKERTLKTIEHLFSKHIINGKLSHFMQDVNQVKNIEFYLTKEERRQALRKIFDKKISSKNASYTYIFQGFLAKSEGEASHKLIKLRHELDELKAKKTKWPRNRLKIEKNIGAIQNEIEKIATTKAWRSVMHAFSAEFILFESYINNPFFNNKRADPSVSLENLQTALKRHQAKIKSILKALRKRTHNADIITHLLNLENKLNDGITLFNDNMDALKPNPTKEQVDCLMCVHDRDSQIPSLGRFMGEQMIAILDTGIKVAYKISGNRVRDALKVPREIGAYSDAKTLIRAKAITLEGAEFNDTYAAIPESMRDSLTAASEQSDTCDSRQWFSIKPYVQNWDPSEVDSLICTITGKPLQRNRSTWFAYSGSNGPFEFLVSLPWVGPERVVASLWEIAWSIPRLGLVFSLGIADFILSFTPWSEQTTTQKLNKILSNVYESPFLTPLSALKRLSYNRYQRFDDEIDEQHQQVLDLCIEDTGFFYKLFRFFTPQLFTRSIREFAFSFYHAGRNVFREINYLDFSHQTDELEDDFYERVKLSYIINKACLEQIEKKQLQYTGDPNDPHLYPERSFCQINIIESPFEVFREIAAIVSQHVIDPTFRTGSPIISAGLFGLASVTWLTYLLPASALTSIKPLVDLLQIPTNQISIGFTGKSATVGPIEAMLACQLEWNLVISPILLIQELLDGNIETFKYLFDQPEKVILGIMTLIGTGMLLQYIPHLPSTITIPGLPAIPNPVFELCNLFSDESRGLITAVDGPKQLTQMLLSVKFLLLIKTLLGGVHERSHQTELETLIQSCTTTGFIKRMADIYHELGLDKQEKDNHALFEALNDEKLFEEGYVIENPIAQQFKDKLTSLLDTAIEHHTKDCVPAEELTEFKANLLHGLRVKLLELPETLKSYALPKAPKFSKDDKYALLKTKRHVLLEALSMTRDEKNPLIFDDKSKGANRYHDRLDRLFNEYNEELANQGLSHYRIDKGPYLDVFYNKYCEQGSNNFIRSMLFFFPIPCYIIAVLWRERQRYKAIKRHKPSIVRQVNKNYNQDFVIVFALIAALSGMIAVAHRAFSYTFRGLADILLGPIAIALHCLYLPYRAFAWGANGVLSLVSPSTTPFKTSSLISWLHQIDEWTCYMTPTHTPPLHPIRQFFAQTTRVSGCNENIKEAFRKVKEQLMPDDEFLNVLREQQDTSYNRVDRHLGNPAKEVERTYDAPYTEADTFGLRRRNKETPADAKKEVAVSALIQFT